MEPEREIQCLRTIVLNYVSSVDKENEQLKKSIDEHKSVINLLKLFIHCDCGCDATHLLVIKCTGCYYHDLCPYCDTECRDTSIHDYVMLPHYCVKRDLVFETIKLKDYL